MSVKVGVEGFFSDSLDGGGGGKFTQVVDFSNHNCRNLTVPRY